MRRSFPAIFAALTLAACGAAGGDEPLASHTEPIANGSLDLEHESVFQLAIHHGDTGSLCTGTLIAPNLLLTARHCVSEGGLEEVICDISTFTNVLPGSSIFATNDPRPAGDSTWFNGLDVRVPAEGDDTCGFDIALVFLASNVPASVATPAVPRIDREVVEGESYLAVGYGTDETGELTGARMSLGNLKVQCAPGSCGAFDAESTEFMGETGTCDGDSGGPAFDMEGKVVGVVSRSDDACDWPIYGTVTAWSDFIVQNALEAAELGGYAPPFWALSGTSDVPPGSGNEGTPCSAPADCASGYACHTLSDPADAVCRATCSSDSQCGDGLSCQDVKGTDISVCLDGGSDDEDEGCTVAGARSPRSAFGALAALALAAVFARRRSPTPSRRCGT